MSISRRRNMVDGNHEKLSISRQCNLLKISRSGMYYKKTGESPYNISIMHEIDKAATEWPFFGVRQMRRHLNRLGFPVGNKRVRRLMRIMNLKAIYQKPRTTIADPSARRYPYLLDKLEINRSNQVWCADITYIPMQRGFLYLMAVMDWHSRKVLSWRLSNTMDTDFCISAAEEAFSKYGKPDIFNTDQGSQFTSYEFTNILQSQGIAISRDGRGRWRDNVLIERLWRSLKYEEVYLHAYENGKEARAGIGKWICFYNQLRPHSSLSGQAPNECYEIDLKQAA